MNRTSILVAVALTLVCSIASAETLAEGTRYEGKKTLEVPTFGLSFELPAGYAGMQPPGDQWFHVGKDQEVGRIFMWASQASPSEVRTTMSSVFPVAGALMLQPKGQIAEDGEALTASYTATDGVNQYDAYARVLTKGGIAVAVVVVAPAEKLEPLKKVGARIASSVKFGVKPKTPKAAKPGNIGSGSWARELKDKHVVRYFHGSGYSEKTEYWLCSTGNFYNNFNATSNSQLGTGVASNRASGQWSVSGSTLQFRWSDGTVSTYALENRDGKLFIDGKRWLREPAPCR